MLCENGICCSTANKSTRESHRFSKSGTEHKKHKTEHKRHKKDFIIGFLCLLCSVPDLLGKALHRLAREPNVRK